MKNCPRCGAGHNVLLCPKEDPDRAFITSEKTCDEEWTEDPEALVDLDRCYMVRKHKPPETKGDKNVQLEAVRAILKELSAEQRGGNKEDDKAAFLQSGRCDQGNLSDLEAQIEKMISKGAFQQLGEKEILELAEKPHLFTQYNWVHNPGLFQWVVFEPSNLQKYPSDFFE